MINKNHKFNLKFILVIFSILLLFGSLCIFAGCNYQKPVKNAASNQFCLMTTTDRHGSVWDKDLLTGKEVNNSFLNQSSAVKEIRKSFDDRTILFDNGDSYQGNFACTDNIAQKSKGNQVDNNPAAVCLKELQYDGYTLGNHEWNYRYDVMKDNYDYLAKNNIPCVCCNVYYKDTGKRVFQPYMLKKINIKGEDFTVAIIGMENTDITSWDFPENYPNMCFYSPENTNRDMNYELKKVQAEMAADGVKPDMTIVSLHSGAFPELYKKEAGYNYRQDAIDRATKPLEAGKNTQDQSLRLLLNSTGVDIVVGGHDHVNYISNTYFKNAEGKSVLYVNAAKDFMSKTCITVNKDDNGNWVKKIDSSENVDLTKYQVDEDLKAKIQPTIDKVQGHLDKKVGTLEGNWEEGQDIKAIDCLTQQTDSMDFCCEAMYWKVANGLRKKYPTINDLNSKISSLYGNVAPEAATQNGVDVDVSFNSFTVSKTVKDGDFYVKNIREICRFENSLAAIPVNGAWIKELLEYNASEIYEVVDGKVQVKNDKRYICPVPFGLNFHYDLTRPVGDRVVIEGFSNGKQFDANSTYVIALPDYYCGNANNPVLEKLDKNKVLWSQTVDDGYGDLPSTIEEFAEYITKNYGPIYNTKNLSKYGLTASKWYIKA